MDMSNKIALITIGKGAGMDNYYKILPLFRQVICIPFDEFNIDSIKPEMLSDRYSAIIIYYCPLEIRPEEIQIKKKPLESITSYAKSGGKVIMDGFSSYYFREILGIKWYGVERGLKKWKLSTKSRKHDAELGYKRYSNVEMIKATKGKVVCELHSRYFRKTVGIARIELGKGEFCVMSHTGIRLFLFSNADYFHESGHFASALKEICDSPVRIMPWKKYSFASILRDDDIFPYMPTVCINKQKRIWDNLSKNGIPVSLAITPKGSSVYNLENDKSAIPPNFTIIPLSKKPPSYLSRIPRSECRYGTLYSHDFVIFRDKDEFRHFKIDTNNKKDFSAYKALNFGEMFTLSINNKTFVFHMDSLDSYSNPTRLWLGLVADINNQFEPKYIDNILSLMKRGFRAQIHGVYHHQHSPVNETGEYGEFYEPGTKNKQSIKETVSILKEGLETMKRTFGDYLEPVFTDAFGNPNKNVIEATSTLRLTNFPVADMPSTWVLQLPINKGKIQNVLGIAHAYGMDFEKITQYWKYAKNTNGVFSLAIHSLLGEEKIYSSLTAAKKYIQLNRREAKICGVWATTPGDAVKFYKAGLSLLQKINVSENKYHNKIKVSFKLIPDLLGLVMKFSNRHYEMKLVEIKGIMKSQIIKSNNKWQYVEFNKIGKVKLTLTYKRLNILN